MKQIAASHKRSLPSLPSLIGDSAFLRGLNPRDYVNEKFGDFTVRDILKELEKTGRAPRPEFRTARFQEGIESPKALKPGMHLEGTVTKVANFGALVDIGVHQDGLVHISKLADKFVKDAHEVVKPGDIVQVRVLEVDLQRKRISLSMKSDAPQAAGELAPRQRLASRQAKQPAASPGTLGQLLRQAQKKQKRD